jgi:hypothetical protein
VAELARRLAVNQETAGSRPAAGAYGPLADRKGGGPLILIDPGSTPGRLSWHFGDYWAGGSTGKARGSYPRLMQVRFLSGSLRGDVVQRENAAFAPPGCGFDPRRLHLWLSTGFDSLYGTSAGLKSRRLRFDSSSDHLRRHGDGRRLRGGRSLTGQSAWSWPGSVPVRARSVSLWRVPILHTGVCSSGERAAPYEGVRGGSIPPGPAGEPLAGFPHRTMAPSWRKTKGCTPMGRETTLRPWKVRVRVPPSLLRLQCPQWT